MAWKIVVVSTLMLPASPTSAGTSNDSKARAKNNSAKAHSAGAAMRKVTARNARSGLAPAMMAASSNEASIERSAADINRNVSGTKPMPSIAAMPPIE